MNEVTVRDPILEWVEMVDHTPGAKRKVLRRGKADQPSTILLTLPPGIEMDRHTHVHGEHHYVLEGEYESMGKSYSEGSYRIIPRHTEHGPIRSENGALILVGVWES